MGIITKSISIIFSNEIKDGVCLDGNFIKKLSSGGDALCARTLYQCKQTFVPQFLTILMSNDISQILNHTIKQLIIELEL
jgi:phage/plasmid-associated DNA primase